MHLEGFPDVYFYPGIKPIIGKQVKRCSTLFHVYSTSNIVAKVIDDGFLFSCQLIIISHNSS